MIVADSLTRHQIAALIGCPVAHVRDAIARLGIAPAVTIGNQELYGLDAIDQLTQDATMPSRHNLPTVGPKPRACGPAASMILPPTATRTTATPRRKPIDPRQAWQNAVNVIMANEGVDRLTATTLAAKRYPERRAALVAAANRTK